MDKVNLSDVPDGTLAYYYAIVLEEKNEKTEAVLLMEVKKRGYNSLNELIQFMTISELNVLISECEVKCDCWINPRNSCKLLSGVITIALEVFCDAPMEPEIFSKFVHIRCKEVLLLMSSRNGARCQYIDNELYRRGLRFMKKDELDELRGYVANWFDKSRCDGEKAYASAMLEGLSEQIRIFNK